MPKQRIIIANWKMKLNLADCIALAKDYKEKFKGIKGEIAACGSPTALSEMAKIFAKSNIKLGAQNVFWEELGAYTGEASPSMLVELGCNYVLIGHSERRKYLEENYEMINKKVKAVLKTEQLTPVVCIGESWDERKTDRRDFVLVDQLQEALSGVDIFGKQQIVIAYEPIWAIGTGTAIEPAEAEYAHKIIKLTLNDLFGVQLVSSNFKIIYGGSIDSKNVKEFTDLENLDGLLVGGASLKVNEFYKIANVILK